MKASTILKSAVSIMAILSCLIYGQVVLAATTTVTESFNTTTYKAANTTAVWDTALGQLRLPTISVASYSQKNMSIARDASGNMIMVWIDSRNGAIDVYGAKYNASGTKLWGDTKLNQSVLLDGVWDQYPKVACDSSSNIYVSYAVSTGNLRLLKYNTNGSFLWDRQADSAAYSAEWCLHDLAVDSSNNIYVIYQRYGPQGTGSYLSKFDTNGTKLWGDKYSGMGNDPSIASNAGYTYVASKSGNIARIDASGNQVWTAGLGSLTQVRLAVDASGNVCAVYNTNFNVFYVKYNTGGSLAAGPIQISNAGQIYLGKELADIATDSSNNKYIVFRDRYNTGNGYDYTLRGQKLNASDTAQWTSGGVMFCRDDFTDQSGADVATDGSGGLFAIWVDSRLSSTSNVYANKVLSGGTRAWSSDLQIFSVSTVYAANAFAQTTAIDTATSNVTAATLTYNATLNGQTINFRMTSNGSNWYDVTPGTKITFPLTGSDLRFMATLITTNNAVTPVLNDVTIVYEHSDSGGTGTFPYRMYWDTSWLNGLSGWMGSSNGASLTCDPAFTGEKYSGNTSTKFTYNPAAETWAGIYSLYSGNWTGTGINLTGNKRLTFMAKSSVNGVVVTFGTGQATDTAKKEVAFTLTTAWQPINIDLAGLNLSSINGVWYFFIEASRNTGISSPITFYVDEVSYDEIPVTIDTTPPTGTPSTPTDQGTTTSSTSLVFNWTVGTSADPETGLNGYYLQVAKDIGFTNLVFNADVGNVTSYTVSSGVVSGSTYYARVRAKNGVGLYGSYSGTSDGIKIDTTIPTGLPSIPTDAGATSTSTTITFNWTAGTAADPESGINGYTLQVSTTTSFSTFIYNAYVGNILTKSITGCTNGLTYYARVRAMNGAGLYGSYTAASDGILISVGSTPTYTVTTTPYSWVTTSTATGITLDDQSKLFTLPFTFTYYGVNYSSVYVCSNGFMSFVSNSTAYSPVAIPSTYQPNALLAAYWRDLNPAKAGSSITYGSFSDKFVVTWSVYNYANANKQTFQVIIYKTGVIIYQYQSVTKDLTTVIGVENSAGTAGVTYASASISNGLALKFSPSTMAAAALGYAPSTDFSEGETYIYPNPAKEGKKPVIHIEVGEADKVELYIYDVAGELQDSFEITDAPMVIDGQYAYEYQWDSTDHASGVYIVRIIATKGSDKLKITKKFAVVK
jgi:hypothetical protein